MTLPVQKKLKVFYSYSHEDEKLREKLEVHLSLLRRQEIISEWHDRNITGGSDFSEKINENLNNADIILLLVSPSFLNSDYCYDKEMTRAMERQEKGEARVIPIILRPCDWQNTQFSKLQLLPKEGRPVTRWEDEDEAFLDIERGIRKVAEELQNSEPQSQTHNFETKKDIKIRAILPSPVVTFVPRHDKGENLIEKIRQLLVDSDNQTVVLWGSGGVGKTTLAAQLARASEHEKQIVWIDADSRPDISVGVLLDEIATQFGEPEVRLLQPSLKHQQTLTLLTETPSLVILDNFETLKPEYQAECLDFLKTRGFDALITTREKISGVKNVNVFEMSEQEANSFLNRLVEDSTFPNSFTEEIRQKTKNTAEHNPLVMQWIVGQIDAAKSPREVFEEIEHGEGDAAERVFNRSFNLPQLGNDGRHILLALSLFVQGARRKSVRGVVGLDKDNKKFNKALGSIANLRLLNVTDASERIFLGGLTRQFAKAYLDKSPSSKSYRQRFVRYFDGFARKHTEPTSVNLNLLEEERMNFFSSIDLAFDLQNWQSTFSISNNISRFLDARGHWEDLISNSKKILSLAKELDNKKEMSNFANILGNAFSNQGEIEAAEKLYNESLEIYRKLGNQSGIAVSLHNLGNLLSDKGEIEAAEKLYNESLEIERKLGGQAGVADSLNNLAILISDKGEIEEAEKLYNESLEIKRKLGEQSGIASSLQGLGNLAKNRGEIEEAEKLYNESLEIYRKLGEQSGIAVSLQNLGSLLSDKGEIEEAEKLYNESLEIYRKLSSRAGIAFLLNSLAELYFLKENIDESERFCRESLEICERLKHVEAISENKRLLGRIFQFRGDFDEAENHYKESLASFRKIGYKLQIALTLKEFASLAEEKGEKDTAIEYLRESLEIFEKIGSPKAEEVRADLERLKGNSNKEN